MACALRMDNCSAVANHASDLSFPTGAMHDSLRTANRCNHCTTG